MEGLAVERVRAEVSISRQISDLEADTCGLSLSLQQAHHPMRAESDVQMSEMVRIR